MRKWCFALLLSMALAAAPRWISSAQTKQPDLSARDAAVFKLFTDRLKTYIDLRKSLESSLPGLKSTSDPTDITTHQRELATKIKESRQNAHQGDIFTPDVAERFRAITRTTFREPGSQAVRRTIQEGDPPGPFVVKVNAEYPANSPVVTTPPTLLMRLPELPKEMAYRIYGSFLVLLDNKTNLVVDFIPDAIP